MSLLALASGWTLPIGKFALGLVVGLGALGLLRLIGVLPARYFRVGLFALIAGCVVGLAALWGTTRPAPLTVRVAVFPVRPSVTTAQADGLGIGIWEATIDLLRRSVTARLRIAARDAVDEAVAEREVSDLASALEASMKLGVQFAAFGEYEKSGGTLSLRMQFLDVGRRTMQARILQCGQDSLSLMPVRLAQAITEMFRLTASGLRPSTPAVMPSSAAFEQYCRGQALFRTRSPDGYWQAGEAYRAALQIDSTYAFPYLGLAQVYRTWQRDGAEYRDENLAMRRKAVQSARKALALNPRVHEAYRLIAQTDIALKNWAGASAALKQAILADPDEPLNYVALAQLSPDRYQDVGFKNAAALCERAVTLNPDSALLRARLVRAYISDGSLNDAVGAGQELVEMAPTFAEGYECLGDAYNFRNKPTRAVAAFTTALQLNPKRPSAYIGLATAHTIKIDHPHAIEAYRRGIAALPQNADLYYNLGVLYQRLGQPDQARPMFEKAVEVGNHLNAHFYLAHLYEKQGKPEQAIEHWRQRVELGDPDDPWTKDARTRLQALTPSESSSIKVK